MTDFVGICVISENQVTGGGEKSTKNHGQVVKRAALCHYASPTNDSNLRQFAALLALALRPHLDDGLQERVDPSPLVVPTYPPVVPVVEVSARRRVNEVLERVIRKRLRVRGIIGKRDELRRLLEGYRAGSTCFRVRIG